MKSYRHILCATDFSPFCDHACGLAAKLAKESGAKAVQHHAACEVIVVPAEGD